MYHENRGEKLLDQIAATDFILRMLFKIEWIKIPAGTFEMGSKKHSGETVHHVSLDSFYMSKTLVTFDQYDIFCEETGREKPEVGDGVLKFGNFPQCSSPS